MSKRAEEASFDYQRELGMIDSVSDEHIVARRMGFQDGYKKAEKDLGWHSVDESLPPIDEEVIVLTDRLNLGAPFAISFGHIVSKMHCWDYNGWNIPGVKYWMPMPKIPKEE